MENNMEKNVEEITETTFDEGNESCAAETVVLLFSEHFFG